MKRTRTRLDISAVVAEEEEEVSFVSCCIGSDCLPPFSFHLAFVFCLDFLFSIHRMDQHSSVAGALDVLDGEGDSVAVTTTTTKIGTTLVWRLCGGECAMMI